MKGGVWKAGAGCVCAVWESEGGWGRESSQFPLRKLPKGRARGMAKHSTAVSGFPFSSTHPNSLAKSANAATGSSSGIRSRQGGGWEREGTGGGKESMPKLCWLLLPPPLIRHSSAAGGRRDKLYVRPLFRGISVSYITLPAGPFPILRTLNSGFLKRDLVLHFRVILPIQIILSGIRPIRTDRKGNKKVSRCASAIRAA